MSLGKSIRIYLKDGTPTGIRVSELVNHTIQSISSPRLKTNELSEFKESNRPGVYFLFGKDEETNEDLAYIGEAENVFQRLQDHLLKKDFWNEVVLFVSKDENLTKGHVKYLESRLIQIALTARRYKIGNSVQPQLSSLPLADRDAMEEFLLQIKMLLGLNGHRLLEDFLEREVRQEKTNPAFVPPFSTSNLELSLTIADICASAIQSNEGIVVLAGSVATNNPSPNIANGYKNLRQKLIDNGSLSLEGSNLKFTEDVLFSSPSAAATVIVGYHINGQTAWKDKNGRSLKSIEEEKVKSVMDQSLETISVL
ncbi:GIY-YIG nuclease family protein [Flavisolibacter sp. BT320]|nr:GIY-YIG nuclease family protein [Flavisolibacter longurius]